MGSGHSNWKNVIESKKGFTKYKSLELRFIEIPGHDQDISKMISDSLLSKQVENRKILRKIILSTRYLASQGLTLRGHL